MGLHSQTLNDFCYIILEIVLQDIGGMISVLVQLVQTMNNLDLPTHWEKKEFLVHIQVC